MAEKKNPPADAAADRNVEQIRDILFGGQMRDYERRFQEMNQRIEGEFARLRADADKRLVALERRLDEQVEKLAKGLRQEVGDRNKALDDLESRLLQAARTQRVSVREPAQQVARLAFGRGTVAHRRGALRATTWTTALGPPCSVPSRTSHVVSTACSNVSPSRSRLRRSTV